MLVLIKLQTILLFLIFLGVGEFCMYECELGSSQVLTMETCSSPWKHVVHHVHHFVTLTYVAQENIDSSTLYIIFTSKPLSPTHLNYKHATPNFLVRNIKFC